LTSESDADLVVRGSPVTSLQINRIARDNRGTNDNKRQQKGNGHVSSRFTIVCPPNILYPSYRQLFGLRASIERRSPGRRETKGRLMSCFEDKYKWRCAWCFEYDKRISPGTGETCPSQTFRSARKKRPCSPGSRKTSLLFSDNNGRCFIWSVCPPNTCTPSLGSGGAMKL
jgi:hypothetical protein